jgi:hypothetical protein
MWPFKKAPKYKYTIRFNFATNYDDLLKSVGCHFPVNGAKPCLEVDWFDLGDSFLIFSKDNKDYYVPSWIVHAAICSEV